MREFFSLNNAYRSYHPRQLFTSGDSKTLILFPRKSSHKAYLYTVRVINNSACYVKTKRKAKSPWIFIISSFIQFLCQVDLAVHKWEKRWKHTEARSSCTRISNISHDVLLGYSLPLTVQVGWRRTRWNEEILDVWEKQAFIRDARGESFA